jgi:signal transduction histidine kinase
MPPLADFYVVRWRPRLSLVAAAGGAGLISLLAFLVPAAAWAYRSPSLHVAIETTNALIALLAAYLVLGRFRESSLVSDLVLVCALALFAFTDLFFLALPAALPDVYLTAFPIWTSLVGTLLGTGTFAAAAFASRRRLRMPVRSLSLGLTACVWALVGTAAAVAVFGLGFSLGFPSWLSPEASDRPLFVGHPIVLTVQLLATLLLAVAAVGFLRRAERTGDELMQWFGTGATLAAFAHLNYLFFPSLYSDWVYTGDFLRLGFYLLVLVGTGREIQTYWHRLAQVAVLEERRRIARELHDGLAQELAFVVAETSGPARAAGERALDESRRAIAALTRPVDEPLDVALVQAAEEVAHRVGTQLRFAVASDLEATADTREALIRIVREAVTNAARHGGASEVRVELENGNGLRLVVADDGHGFDSEAPRGGGFGIIGMRERAEALGGVFTLSSEPGAGTAIEVVLP